jgi:hypothetical protein
MAVTSIAALTSYRPERTLSAVTIDKAQNSYERGTAMTLLLMMGLGLLALGALASAYGADSRPPIADRRPNV